ncbi:disintegrin and metalloproteinase domain-containing protein 12, partial [Asbolus verrucosus]
TCKPKNAGTMCRSADYECDLPEYCTGQSEYCPADIYKMDTEICDHGKAFCYHGFCRTRTDQCKLLWGETGKSSDEQCYKMNVKGNRHGNCGYNKLNQSYFKCNDENVLCGMLHCKHLNERLEFGMESVSILSHSFLNLKGSIVACRTAIVDLGINQVDPGLAPDGAKCGEGKMCVNQKCMSVASLQVATRICPHNCNNNGWCNNLGHCHCKDGYAPPFCENPGTGGSEDSGPASDPNARKEFVVALFVIFLGIIPAMVLLAFLTYYVRHNILNIRPSKPSPPTYVKNCLLSSFQHVLSACKGGSFFSNRSNTSKSVPNQPNNIRNVEIKPAGLISTTNTDVIIRSNTITKNTNVETGTGGTRRLSLKNIKALKLNTRLSIHKNKESSPSQTPATAETICSLDDKPTLVLSVRELTKKFANDSAANVSKTMKSQMKSRGVSFSPDSTKRTEDNHSLLQDDRSAAPGLQNEFFGHFKGFSLTPMKKASETEPTRIAPPPPVIPPSAPKIFKSPLVGRSNTTATTKNFLNRSVTRAQSFKNNIAEALSSVNSTPGPALPPPNPGSTAKPIISSPILENSTCTAKELISPLRNAPKVPLRAAPEAPPLNKRPLSTPDAIAPLEEMKKKEGNSALNRIASFLNKKPNTNTNSLPRAHQQVKANKILDKDTLRSIEISNPILQTETSTIKAAVPVKKEENKAVIMRAQSMRGSSVTARPNIQTFGSMRQPGGMKRPLSIPTGSRPKSPPPPAPPILDVQEKKLQIPSLPGYQKPIVNNKSNQNQYDDCLNKVAPLSKLNEESSNDNIYAVIEESPISPESVKSIEDKAKTSSSSTDSMGLLGEIVSEIQNRNFDSIYSTSTLARKKKEELEKAKIADSEIYVNTSSVYKSPESVYSNMNNIKSSASSTSSGYIHPSSVNVPLVKPPEEKKEEKKMSTFKSDSKPLTLNRSQASPVKSRSPTPTKKTDNKAKTPPSPSGSKTAKTTINRQTTPPNLRTRKPSPTRTAPGAPKSRPVSNSPDLVTSCNTKPGSKPPDVLNGGIQKKPTITSAKPNLGGLPKGPSKPKAVSFKTGERKSASTVNKSNSEVGAKTLPAGVKNAAKSSSNVASLQQKFE